MVWISMYQSNPSWRQRQPISVQYIWRNIWSDDGINYQVSTINLWTYEDFARFLDFVAGNLGDWSSRWQQDTFTGKFFRLRVKVDKYLVLKASFQAIWRVVIARFFAFVSLPAIFTFNKPRVYTKIYSRSPSICSSWVYFNYM